MSKALLGMPILLSVSAQMADKLLSIPTKEIAHGLHMPVISIGDGGQETTAAYTITSTWLALGGRGIDTANDYDNQEIVAEAIGNSSVTRQDVFITTKIPECDQVDYYIQQDLAKLGTDYIDLLLIHFPASITGKGNCSSAWSILEKYHEQGILRAIGVSHFKRSDLVDLMQTAKIVPHVNQVEYNIIVHDDDQIAACAELGINVEAYCPLGRSGISANISTNPTIQRVAAAHKVSTYQVAIKWILQKGHLLTFQSSKKSHQESDADVFDFNLSASEVAELDTLHEQVIV